MVRITKLYGMNGEYWRMDSTDARIVSILIDNGRSTVLEISELIGLSPTPVSRRIRKLEETGVITRYSALLDETKMGFGVSVFVSVKLEKQIDNDLANFETAIHDLPEVVDCWLMTGNRDYLLRVATRSLAEFEQFLTGKLTRISSVASIESSIPLRRVKAGIARSE